MHDAPDLPAPRSLRDRPQPFGLLPTMWFWNDHARQRLVMPLMAVTGVPLSVVLVYVHAQPWLLLAFLVLHPLLIMGLVERRVRRALHVRSLDAIGRLAASDHDTPCLPLPTTGDTSTTEVEDETGKPASSSTGRIATKFGTAAPSQPSGDPGSRIGDIS
jgi:hypothetical protein